MARGSTPKSDEAKLAQTRGAKVRDNPQPRAKRTGIKPPPPKNEVERADRYVNATASGDHAAVVKAAMRRANELKAYLEPKTTEMADVMVAIAKNRKVHASIRLEAATRVLDRVYGKAKEHVVHEDPETTLGGVDEVTKLLNNILTQVGAPTIDGPGSVSVGSDGSDAEPR